MFQVSDITNSFLLKSEPLHYLNGLCHHISVSEGKMAHVFWNGPLHINNKGVLITLRNTVIGFITFEFLPPNVHNAVKLNIHIKSLQDQ